MTDEPTPDTPTGRRTAARRRRLAYLAAAIILLIAGTVAGVIATRPSPKPARVAAVKAKPKPITLSTAEFFARWAAVTDGPSDVTRGTPSPPPFAPTVHAVTVGITAGPVWHWSIPTGGGTVIAGTASASGSTSTTTYTSWPANTPAAVKAAGPPAPYVQHDSPGWTARPIKDGTLPLVSVSTFAGFGNIRTLSQPTIQSATASTWTVRMTVTSPWCWQHFPIGTTASAAYVTRCGAVTTAPPTTSTSQPTTATAPPTERIPGPTATATVTPTAQGGLLISIAPTGYTLLANPT